MATEIRKKRIFTQFSAAAYPVAIIDIVAGDILFSKIPKSDHDSQDLQTDFEEWLNHWLQLSKKGIKELLSALTTKGVLFEDVIIGGIQHQLSIHNYDSSSKGTLVLQFFPLKPQRAELSLNSFQWVDDLPEGIIIHKKGKVIYLNEQAATLLNVKKESALRNPFHRLFPKTMKDEVEERVNKWEAGEKTEYLEFEVALPGGEKNYLGERTVSINVSGETVCQTIVSDLSVHKRWIHEKMRAQLAEEINQILKHEIKEHKVTQYELEQARNFNAAVIESSLDMIVAENAEGRVSVFNRAAEKQYGYDRSEIIGKSTQLLFSSEKEYNRIQKALKANKNIGTEIRNKKKNGEEFTSFLSASLLYTTDGKLLGSMGVSRDISEQKRAAESLRRSEELYRDLFDNMSDAYLMLDAKGRLTHWNKAGLDILGVSGKNASELNLLDWVSKEDRKVIETARERAKQSGKTIKGLEYFLINGRKQHRWVQVNMSPVFENNKFVGTRELLRDISEQKSAQEVAAAQTAKIRSIFESTDYMIWSVDKEKRLTSFNSQYAVEFRKRSNVEPRIGIKAHGFTSYSKSGQKAFWESQYREAFKGKSQQFELELSDPKGRRSWYDVVLNPIESVEGKTHEISGIAHSVTFKKQAEVKIKEQAAKINSIFDSTAMLIYTLDNTSRVTSYNANFAKSLARNFNIEIQIGCNIVDLLEPFMRKDLHKRLKKLYKEALNGQYIQFEGPLKKKNDQIIWIETFLNPIFSEDGTVQEISCMAHEITDKKLIEKQMRESLEEKEILLQEVHHRVKNNLQVISSILNLQSSYVKDPNTLGILRESQNRIKSMSFIHESLYQTSDFSSIDFSDYILSLSKNLVHSYSINTGLVELDTQFERVFLNLDQAIPCGLIINELVSNALKYAFPNGRKGKLMMRIQETNGRVSLVIKDDGVGVPPDFDFDRSDTLGLQLVFTLIEQLDGEVSFQSEQGKGTEYLITFDKIQ